MFSKFNLKLDESDFEEHYEYGKEIYNAEKNKLEASIVNLKDEHGIIDGKKLQEMWFPLSKKYDIFLSHSHSDEKLAISLAGYLKEQYNLSVFIDSCLWGYSNELLREIDENYCRHSNGSSFDYDKRNYSTSHIHMMLSTALNNMIDKCESIFFLNTKNSINLAEDIGNDKTMSPWIHSELNSVNIINIKSLDKYRPSYKIVKMTTGSVVYNSLNENHIPELKISYDVTDLINNLVNITKDDLMQIKNSNIFNLKLNPLDKLYYNMKILKVEEMLNS